MGYLTLTPTYTPGTPQNTGPNWTAVGMTGLYPIDLICANINQATTAREVNDVLAGIQAAATRNAALMSRQTPGVQNNTYLPVTLNGPTTVGTLMISNNLVGQALNVYSNYYFNVSGFPTSGSTNFNSAGTLVWNSNWSPALTNAGVVGSWNYLTYHLYQCTPTNIFELIKTSAVPSSVNTNGAGGTLYSISGPTGPWLSSTGAVTGTLTGSNLVQAGSVPGWPAANWGIGYGINLPVPANSGITLGQNASITGNGAGLTNLNVAGATNLNFGGGLNVTNNNGTNYVYEGHGYTNFFVGTHTNEGIAWAAGITDNAASLTFTATQAMTIHGMFNLVTTALQGGTAALFDITTPQPTQYLGATSSASPINITAPVTLDVFAGDTWEVLIQTTNQTTSTVYCYGLSGNW
jgi:hypothetical protein